MFAKCHAINPIMSSRNGRSEGIQRACPVSFLMNFHRKLATSEAGPETGLQLISARQTTYLWNCKLYNWADLDRQDCSRSLVVSYKRELLKSFSQRQVTCLVEGPSQLGHLLVLEIRSGAGVISLGKFQNISSSTGYQVWPLHTGATSTSWACWRRDNFAN